MNFPLIRHLAAGFGLFLLVLSHDTALAEGNAADSMVRRRLHSSGTISFSTTDTCRTLTDSINMTYMANAMVFNAAINGNGERRVERNLTQDDLLTLFAEYRAGPCFQGRASGKARADTGGVEDCCRADGPQVGRTGTCCNPGFSKSFFGGILLHFSGATKIARRIFCWPTLFKTISQEPKAGPTHTSLIGAYD